MAHAKFTKLSEKFVFFSNFLNIFNFLLILMHIFEKLPQILGLYTIVNFRSTLEKSDPPNILWTPLNRKFLPKLLIASVLAKF